MSESDDIRKTALAAAERARVIAVEAEPEVVLVGEPIRITARFYSRSSQDIRHLDLVDVAEPVVEVMGEVRQGETQITTFKRVNTGVYTCELSATIPGTRAYIVKESREENAGELVEVEVLNRQADNLLGALFQRFTGGKT